MSIAAPKLATSGTGMRAISRVGINNGDAFLQSFIFDKPLELSKRPGVMDVPSLFSNPEPFPDVGQLLHHDNIAFAEAIDNPAAYVVVEPADYSVLLSRKLFQELFGSFRAFGLESRPQSLKSPPYMHCLLSRKPETIGNSSNIVDAKVYSNGISARWSGNWLGEDNIDVKPFLPFGPAVNQNCRRWFLTFKKMPLVVTQNKGDFNSALNCGERYHLLSRNIAENSLVIGRRSWLKFFDFAKPSFRRFCYPGNSSYRKVSCQAVSFLKLTVAKMLELYFVGCFVFLSYLKNMTAGVGKAPKSCPKSFNLLWGRIKFALNCLDKFHYTVDYITLAQIHQRKGVWAHSSHP